MSVVSTPAEQRVVLHNVSWETYERILADQMSSRSPRFTFDRGELEIMSPSPEHERYIWRIGDLIGVLAEALDLEGEGLGSTTFRRGEIERGFEPDCCFYFENAERVRGKDRLDMRVDPPPDLVVEIDVTSPSRGRFPIFAEFGVPEVWRLRGGRLSMFRLAASSYQEVSESKVLPGVSATALSQLLAEGATFGRTAWLKLVRAWAHERFGKTARTDDGLDK
jgi:Uma2 family endonuclease